MKNNIYIEYCQSYSVTNEGNYMATTLSNALSTFKGNSIVVNARLNKNEYKKFLELKKKWFNETMFISSSTQIYSNSAYREIIDMGMKSIPWIIKDLKKTNAHWFNALYRITGENPINLEHAGIVQKMADDWIEWAENRGYVVASHTDFPNSHAEPFLITASQTWSYNCIAWAFGDNTRWYWPTEHPNHYWPPDIRRELDLQSFVELYQLIGYSICNDTQVEVDIEKIAIFAKFDGEPTHASKQLPNGNWTSKLGPWHDVEHTLNSVSEGGYGNASIIMSRPLK